ncbi:unnamed protein product, partial [Symbiodinium pilosum]
CRAAGEAAGGKGRTSATASVMEIDSLATESISWIDSSSFSSILTTFNTRSWKCIVVVLAVLIIVLLIVGGYYYYTTTVQQPAVTTTTAEPTEILRHFAEAVVFA